MRKEIAEKIKQLEGQNYADFNEVVKEWNDALDRIEIDKAFAKLKNTKDIISACNDRILVIDKKLSEERHMTVEDREYLLGVKDTLKTFVYWFDPKDYDERQRSIEDEIKSK
jgi:hypothetical protein